MNLFVPSKSALERLFPFNWRATLALNGLILVVLFFVYGFWWPYWRIADMDFWMVYEGMLFNDGLPQEFFDHPAYLSILFTGIWFWAGHQFALLNSVSLSSLPSPFDVGGFEAAWTAATRAGRLLSLVLTLTFVGVFAMLLRRLVQDWRVAALGAILLIYSGGLAMQARIMRPELISAGLTTVALLLLLTCAQRGGVAPAIGWIGRVHDRPRAHKQGSGNFLGRCLPPHCSSFWSPN